MLVSGASVTTFGVLTICFGDSTVLVATVVLTAQMCWQIVDLVTVLLVVFHSASIRNDETAALVARCHDQLEHSMLLESIRGSSQSALYSRQQGLNLLCTLHDNIKRDNVWSFRFFGVVVSKTMILQALLAIFGCLAAALFHMLQSRFVFLQWF